MSISASRAWLIAYDIADPDRLRRVHTFLKRNAVPIQYSLFVARMNERALREVLAGVEERICAAEDDVRAYPVPDRCDVVTVGRQYLPEGVVLTAEGVDNLLHRSFVKANGPEEETA